MLAEVAILSTLPSGKAEQKPFKASQVESSIRKKLNVTLAGGFSWLEHPPGHQKVVGSVPCWAYMIPDPGAYRRQ